MNEIKNSIKKLKIWKDSISIDSIEGGLTNQNFLINDGSDKFFVRIGKDINEHLVFRRNEITASKAASLAGVAPKLIHSEKGIIVFEYIESKTYNSDLVIKNIDQVIKTIKKIHNDIPNYISGSPPLFWVFHVIQHYSNFLKNNNSPYLSLLDDFIKKSSLMNNIASPYDIVFCHNDFLAANFIEDKCKIWVVDWEYAGFNTPLFDLGGLASNNGFTEKQELYLLENYFEKKIDDNLIAKYLAIKCASLLRETMWSMVSEITSKIDFDYKDYTNQNLLNFNDEFKKLKN
tara:strand:+ start:182 stop:1048 length:867 start_codon:yes stop_codon:yes gene_type:complete